MWNNRNGCGRGMSEGPFEVWQITIKYVLLFYLVGRNNSIDLPLMNLILDLVEPKLLKADNSGNFEDPKEETRGNVCYGQKTRTWFISIKISRLFQSIAIMQDDNQSYSMEKFILPDKT